MPANVEIKARARDFAQLHDLARTLSNSSGHVIMQEDVFFHTPTGRLKLRVLAPDHGELIAYHRADVAGPKHSSYVVTRTPDPEGLKGVLTAALGQRGVVRKRRTLYMVGQTRVHLDEVESLGQFVELEVMLQPDQTVATGQQIATALMQQLQISDTDLLSGAYVDLLLQA